MPSFRYTARTQPGELQTGVVEASSRTAAASILQQHQLIITGLSEVGGGTLLQALERPVSFLERVSRKDIITFSQQVAILFESRVPLLEALHAIAEQTTNPVLARAMLAIIADIEGGTPFSDAIAKHPKLFSSFYVNLVRSGEASGKLRESFDYLARYLEREYVVVSKIRGSLLYPAFVLTVFFIVVAIMVTVVLPQVGLLFAESNVELPLTTRIILGSATFARNTWWFWASGLLIFFVFGGRLLRTSEGKAWVDERVLRLPVVGPLIHALLIARFADNLGTLVTAGIPLIQALEITGAVVGNAVFKDVLAKTIQAVQRGEQINVTFRDSWVIPPTVVQMVAIGERTGRLDTVLVHIARFYQREVDTMTDALVSLIEPALIVFLGIGVGIFVASVLLPIYTLSSAL
ncbi:MAG: hypothetical protein A2991_03885 [Candidatus Terrybacteria bacterium RIFCSPLOWO2_01_FULL_58_14]|uniref:Type II secretion system protein GspF domain-containing protein n=2 Tax=Candidatus Terryibacteriota TaxID=1817920 RepID=A0A1G2Q091_9BACT|nr:MAG: hypothetical protein A2682_02530 [Candidatus Terrybacteria bacterium RIFCSPHIGHO2_01_FULL_58_15]OHA54006.1 MAG: hypothetical protein A2991_03885 [Candidatus Terrybacteria bacterium RIFCSPLOWO2_01_FULL_58_14]